MKTYEIKYNNGCMDLDMMMFIERRTITETKEMIKKVVKIAFNSEDLAAEMLEEAQAEAAALKSEKESLEKAGNTRAAKGIEKTLTKYNRFIGEMKKQFPGGAEPKKETRKEEKPMKEDKNEAAAAVETVNTEAAPEASYTINEEFNGIEITFTGKPAAAIREILKATGYRWHNKKGLWYAKRTPARLQIAEWIAA